MNAKPIIIAEGTRKDKISRLDRVAARHLCKHRLAAPPNDRAIVSFTFDDVPDSSVANGARILEAHGCAGTFYLAGGLCGASFGQWRFFAREDVPRLIDGGHEIGCHTFSHPVIQSLDARALGDEFDRNRRWLTDVDSRVKLSNFAYPYGAVGIFQKGVAARRFRSCRGVGHGYNVGSLDRAQLRAVQLYDHRLNERTLAQTIAEAVRTRAWLIFYTHDVQDGPTDQGCSPRLMEQAVAMAIAAGCDIRTVDDAMSQVEAAAGTLPLAR